jgi:hypothetical protein
MKSLIIVIIMMVVALIAYLSFNNEEPIHLKAQQEKNDSVQPQEEPLVFEKKQDRSRIFRERKRAYGEKRYFSTGRG